MNIRTFSIVSLSILPCGSVLAQANAGPDQYICGNSTNLQANILAVDETGFWDGGASGAVFVDAADPLTEVSNLPYGVTELT